VTDQSTPECCSTSAAALHSRNLAQQFLAEPQHCGCQSMHGMIM
jgi:hypothetical protein